MGLTRIPGLNGGEMRDLIQPLYCLRERKDTRE